MLSNNYIFIRLRQTWFYLIVLTLAGCGFSAEVPKQGALNAENRYVPQYTSYTDGIRCSQVSQLMITETGRNNIGLMVGAFMTGTNYQKKRSNSVTIDKLLASVNWYCKDNPSHTVTEAMISIDKDLDKGLLKQAKPSGEKLLLTAVKQAPQNPPKAAVKPQVPPTTAQKVASKPNTVKKQTISLPKRDPGGSHVVQVLSTQVPGEATKLVEDLKKKGLPTYVVGVDLGSKGYWNRVLVGPYSNQQDAQKVALILGKLKYNTFVRLR